MKHFYEIRTRQGKRKGDLEIYPEFKVGKTDDLMVRGHSFYAIWDEDVGMWSTNDYDVQRIIDSKLQEAYEKEVEKNDPDIRVKAKFINNFSSSTWKEFQSYLKSLPDNAHQLDAQVTFLSTKAKREDYISKRLPYDLEDSPTPAYDEMVKTLYSQPEREKFEWAIGSVLAGESKDIQKFIVFYGGPGTGKSTVIDIIQLLFEGYWSVFDAKSLASNSGSFSMEPFKENPLVAIQHDGDLSRIEDNTKLNSIVSHETMPMNEKFKNIYSMRLNSFLFMGTNKPVKITDSNSGIIRRLIDVSPTGNTLDSDRYFALKERIKFELGGIAKHCLDIYRRLGPNRYRHYKPTDMMYKTDPFFNFVADTSLKFISLDREQGGLSLTTAYESYVDYCDKTNADYKLQRYKFKEELKNYFREFKDVTRIDGKQVRSWYCGFIEEKLTRGEPKKAEPPKPDIPEHRWLVLTEQPSLLDTMLADCYAQYASEKDIPSKSWDRVVTRLYEIDTSKTHYVRVPKNHIVIDFDLTNDKGEKDREANLSAASEWPPTYAEFSKSGKGVHLHYIYDGDVDNLSCIYKPGIEVKVFSGKQSLRRRLTACNDIPVAHISAGLKQKETKMVNLKQVKDDKHLIALIKKALNKEIPPYATKTSIDFIKKILDEAYDSGMHYDVSSLRPQVMAFANNSTHNALYCLREVAAMKFTSEQPGEPEQTTPVNEALIFYDVEVLPNLFIVCWKEEGEGKSVVRMINPSSEDIRELTNCRLVGFNCRRYDNHILYARLMGDSIEDLYKLSQRIVNGSRDAMFSNAYNLSYTDVYDFSSKKQSLKKFEIDLGIHHQELGWPWDKPVPKEMWETVADYCSNDVIATEAVFHARKADWMTRKILAALTGLTVNDTTNTHSTKFIFGDDKNPQRQFNYRDMGKMDDYETYNMPIEDDVEWAIFDGAHRPIFKGYSFDNGKSIYRGEEVGEGGYVYAEKGVYTNVALLDIASMHPSSIVAEQLFGPKYTARFQDILDARIAAKHFDREAAARLLDGQLLPYMDTEQNSTNLSQALKIVINSVYGLTAATFSNAFKDPRNKDNIVAKRGALFMVNLKNYVQKLGYTVAHIKTDSIKIPNADDYIIGKVMAYGKEYGYTFEHEATYQKMCLVNDAVYIARYDSQGVRNKGGKHANEWTATGAQFQHPYVFKTLFSHEPIEFSDLCETKAVTTALYLDLNESLGEDEHNYKFVGKAGSFCPIKPGHNGGLLLREKDGKFTYTSGTKGYRWLESELVRTLGIEGEVDLRYFDRLLNDAKDAVSKYADFELFASDDEYRVPWEETN